MPDQFILFIFHGSSVSESIRACSNLVDSIKKNGLTNFKVCYLRENSPSFKDALENLYNDGYKNIKCFPMLLLPGSHIKQEIPSIIQNFKSNHPDSKIELMPCLAENKLFSDFILKTLGCHCEK